ncbi:DUF6892 domain-containing protein [Streptomyces sp. NPDC048258]|uniref:DUF6892 domain-containing protein n=1 Tax=Streptomyces sp. NPDC048258 TaxID=3365527 RepID=UPI00371372D1
MEPQPAVSRPAVFKDFNFKLLVIEKLMYQDQVLTPVFSIDELMEARGIGDVQSHVFDNDLAFTVLDESRTFFEELAISEELLAGVDELLVDGGNQIYYECSPVWDGEDDLFDVQSLDDLALLPNLKRLIGADSCAIVAPDKLERLAAQGVATT